VSASTNLAADGLDGAQERRNPQAPNRNPTYPARSRPSCLSSFSSSCHYYLPSFQAALQQPVLLYSSTDQNHRTRKPTSPPG
jgi:hypothetical protein